MNILSFIYKQFLALGLMSVFLLGNVWAQKKDTNLNGIILDDEKKAVPNTLVIIDGNWQVSANAEGLFSLPYKQKEPNEVVTFAKGFKEKAWYYNPKNNSVKVELTKGNVMAGRVVDRENKPLPNTKIHIVGFKTEEELHTDKHGYFRLLLPEDATIHNAYEFRIHKKLHSEKNYVLNPACNFYTITYDDGVAEIDKKKESSNLIEWLVLLHTNQKKIGHRHVTIDKVHYVTDENGVIHLNQKVPKNTEFNLNGYTIVRSEFFPEEERLHLTLSSNYEEDAPLTFEDGSLENVDKDFEQILENLKQEKNLIRNTSSMLGSEVEKIQKRMAAGEKLSVENKTKLGNYLAEVQKSMKEVHEQENKEYDLANNELIFNLQSLLLEKDSINKIIQARLLKTQAEKELAANEYKSKIYKMTFAGVFLIVLALVGYALAIRIRTQKKQLEASETELIVKVETINKQKEEINELYHEQTDSIKLANVIQQAILPPVSFIKNNIEENFILFKPKSIVSGDFYWFDVKDGYSYFASVDCTGHGVAGGFTSMLGYSLLNLALSSEENPSPATILDKLNEGVIRSLRQGEEGSQSKDGMDITLIKYKNGDSYLELAGGGNPLYLVRNGELLQYKTDKFGIGIPKLRKEVPKFSNFTVDLQQGDMVYIFSDGYADQLGGKDGMQKFMYGKLRELILSIHHLPVAEQHDFLNKTFDDFKGSHEQTDDLTMIGMKITTITNG